MVLRKCCTSTDHLNPFLLILFWNVLIEKSFIAFMQAYFHYSTRFYAQFHIPSIDEQTDIDKCSTFEWHKKYLDNLDCRNTLLIIKIIMEYLRTFNVISSWYVRNQADELRWLLEVFICTMIYTRQNRHTNSPRSCAYDNFYWTIASIPLSTLRFGNKYNRLSQALHYNKG